MEGVGYQATHQPRQTKTASQSVPKKIGITIPNLMPFSNYLQVLFPSSFCQLLSSHLLVRVWVCLLSDLTTGSWRREWWGCLRSIRYFLEIWHQAFMSWLFLSSNNILLMCKSPKKFFFELCPFCIVLERIQGSLVQGWQKSPAAGENRCLLG